MIKKLSFSILLIFIFTILFTSPIKAACHPPNQYLYCGSGETLCPSRNLCCDNPRACPPYLNCDDGRVGIETALGCLPLNGVDTLQTILDWAAILSAGLALILIIFGSFQMIASHGDPKKIQAASEVIASAIGGVIFITLSLLVANWVGASLLNLGPLGFIISP